jgi:thiopurine S-methyltransferase
MNENSLWLERWENREIGFNQVSENIFMVEYFKHLDLDEKSRVFVPLCGKTIDISWLLKQGYDVVAIELSEQAVIELFEELQLKPEILELGTLKHYRVAGLDVYVGDVFDLTEEMIGSVDAIYDRAALVALTKEVRTKYTSHLRKISNGAPQLLLCFEYDQSLMNRTPYSVEENEVKEHYSEHYEVKQLCKEEIIGGFKGKIPASDVVWLLK